MMPDSIETIHGSRIQHGHHNHRIYVMQLNPTHLQDLIAALDRLAREKGYGKIIAKIPAPVWHTFHSAGYVLEAAIPHLFSTTTDGLFVAKYVSIQRAVGRIDLNSLVPSRPAKPAASLTSDSAAGSAAPVRDCRESDVWEMGEVYRRVFPTYPFPIHDPQFLLRTIRDGIRYFCIRHDGKIAALAAAELDRPGRNAEMTDFATLPRWRGRGLAGVLLDRGDFFANTTDCPRIKSLAQLPGLLQA